jgi:hypothetical protein
MLLLQLLAHGVEDGTPAQATFGKALLETPQRTCVGDMQLNIELAKVLEAHAVEHLVFAVLIAQVVQRRQEYHDLGEARRETAFAAVCTRTGRINRTDTAPRSISPSVAARFAT